MEDVRSIRTRVLFAFFFWRVLGEIGTLVLNRRAEGVGRVTDTRLGWLSMATAKVASLSVRVGALRLLNSQG